MGSITWRKTGVYVLVALPVLGLAGIAVLARQQQDTSQQSGTDSLADAARKTREQKKAEPKTKKVYTTDDLGGPTAPAAAASATSDGKTKEGANGAGTADNASADKGAGANNNTEEAWRKRFKEARDKLAQAEQELDILQREQQKAQVQYYADPQKALSEQYTRKDVSDRDTKIDAKKQEIAQMKQHLVDMEDELRKSGGDSGWAR